MSATSSTPASERGKRLVRIAAWTTGATATFALGVALFAHGALRPPRKRRRFVTVQGLPCEEVAFPATDGVQLHGWFVPADEARGAVLLCHGYLGNRESLVGHAKFLHAAGYATLLFDFRAAGESCGNLCSFGYREAQDVKGAIAFLQQRPETAALPIAGLGLSMGAVALLLAAHDTAALRLVVADGMYPTLEQAIDRRLRLMFGPLAPAARPIVRRVVRRRLGFDPREVSPLSVVAELEDRPTLFIHADQDVYLAAEHAEQLHERALEPKSLWCSPGARHCRSFATAPEEYARQVLGFLAAHGF